MREVVTVSWMFVRNTWGPISAAICHNLYRHFISRLAKTVWRPLHWPTTNNKPKLALDHNKICCKVKKFLCSWSISYGVNFSGQINSKTFWNKKKGSVAFYFFFNKKIISFRFSVSIVYIINQRTLINIIFYYMTIDNYIL